MEYPRQPVADRGVVEREDHQKRPAQHHAGGHPGHSPLDLHVKPGRPSLHQPAYDLRRVDDHQPDKDDGDGQQQ